MPAAALSAAMAGESGTTTGGGASVVLSSALASAVLGLKNSLEAVEGTSSSVNRYRMVFFCWVVISAR